MKNIISAFGSELTEVTIDDLRDGTFYAKLSIDNQLIDSRPSDAIALAVRYGAQIFVSSGVMDEASFVPEEEDEEGPPKEGAAPKPPKAAAQPPKDQPPGKMGKLEQLNTQLKQAIEKEEYEKAAALRDEIRKLELRD
jgi:bifunctional DNase/RNase